MENNFKDSDQFVLSYELLQLMEWLLESEPEALKKLIKKSLKNGLGAKLKKEKNNSIIAHQAQDGIINFLTLFEYCYLNLWVKNRLITSCRKL